MLARNMIHLEAKKTSCTDRLDMWLISEHICNATISTNIKPAIKTDHSLICLELSNSKEHKRGRGFWKHNSSLLHNPKYVAEIKKCINDAKVKYQDVGDCGLKWDLIKMEIRNKSICFSKLKARTERNHEQELIKKAEELECNLGENTDNNDNTNEYFITKTELDQLNEIRTNGIILRSKTQWAEHGEKCSQYFLNLEKWIYKNKHIHHIKELNGKDL